MKEFKGTKQEWLIDGKTVYAIHDSVLGGKMSKANRFYCTMYPDHHSKNAISEVQYNMNLIKAAPDLLKALQGIVSDFEMDYVMSDGKIVGNPDTSLRVNYEIAKKAINKALGDGNL